MSKRSVSVLSSASTSPLYCSGVLIASHCCHITSVVWREGFSGSGCNGMVVARGFFRAYSSSFASKVSTLRLRFAFEVFSVLSRSLYYSARSS